MLIFEKERVGDKRIPKFKERIRIGLYIQKPTHERVSPSRWPEDSLSMISGFRAAR